MFHIGNVTWKFMLAFSVSMLFASSLMLTTASAASAAPRASQLSQRHPGFDYHLIGQHTSTFIGASQLQTTTDVRPGAIGNASPPDPCLNLYMTLSNPQTDIMEVYVSVQNWCGSTVNNITLDWDTGGKCNGNQFLGPSDSYNVGSLGSSRGWGASSDWSTVCWGEDFPYYPVPFTISGFDDGSGNGPGFAATGSYDTQTYTFI